MTHAAIFPKMLPVNKYSTLNTLSPLFDLISPLCSLCDSPWSLVIKGVGDLT